METIAAVGDVSQGNCKALAAAMKAEMDKARPDIEALETMKNDASDKAARQWFEKAYGGRMMALMGKLINAAKACKDDPDFQQTMADSPFSARKKAAATTAPLPAAPAPGSPSTPARP
jgi:hypothetical protein